MPDFIGRYFIDKDLGGRLVQDLESKAEKHIRAPVSRGYQYLPSMDMDTDLVTEYEYQINRCLSEYQQEYPHSKDTICPYQIDFPFNFQKYNPDHHYSVWHCENNGEKQYRNRHLAFMTYLNTVDDGGETEFLHQNLKIKPEIGLTLIWPAYFTHIHRGIPSKTQEKYIATGWFTFFDTDSFLETNLDASDDDFFTMLDQLNRKVS